jgi:hypothetical protein
MRVFTHYNEIAAIAMASAIPRSQPGAANTSEHRQSHRTPIEKAYSRRPATTAAISNSTAVQRTRTPYDGEYHAGRTIA